MEQFEEAVRDYEKVHKGDRGNMEYRYTASTRNVFSLAYSSE